ncbi:MAG: hypothetical protein PHX51_02630 [Clostridia bacterium]|nr:hypothetical protein [Clostridia bacterium]
MTNVNDKQTDIEIANMQKSAKARELRHMADEILPMLSEKQAEEVESGLLQAFDKIQNAVGTRELARIFLQTSEWLSRFA